MSRKPVALDLDDDDDLGDSPAAVAPPPQTPKDLAGAKPKPPGPKPDLNAVKAVTESSGFTRDTPRDIPGPAGVGASGTDAAQGRDQVIPDVPWQGASVKPNRREPFNLRMREPVKRMLDFLEQEGHIRSMNGFLNEIIEDPIREAIIEILVSDFNMSKRDAKRLVEQEGE